MESPEVGEESVRIARAALEAASAPDPPSDPAEPFRERSLAPEFDEPRGVFVTLTLAPDDRLRGCIGFPAPIYPLRQAVPRAAVAAAREDPRFPPVEAAELDRIRVEVSLLTAPRAIESSRPEARLQTVEVGRHGLIVRRGRRAGLLLPQVATEYGWDAQRFLMEACEKAGLPPDAWRDPSVVVETFEAVVYGERTPRGPIEARGVTPPARSEPRT